MFSFVYQTTSMFKWKWLEGPVEWCPVETQVIRKKMFKRNRYEFWLILSVFLHIIKIFSFWCKCLFCVIGNQVLISTTFYKQLLILYEKSNSQLFCSYRLGLYFFVKVNRQKVKSKKKEVKCCWNWKQFCLRQRTKTGEGFLNTTAC